MVRVMTRAAQLARHRVPVLIQGETGVGKELLARAMHGTLDFSAPFVVFNCGAASRELMGAELFGHVKGAFTGATADGRPGRFELADGGTLCLDEIGELPLELQPMLLRALEEGVIYRLGDTAPRKISVRLIAITNRDMNAEIVAGRFRRDLFYRINVASIVLPPLRERLDDIPALLLHFNNTVASRHGVAPRIFSDETIARLKSHNWPGNVRELRNLIESLLLTGSGEVTNEDLAFGGSSATEAGSETDLLSKLERDAIDQVIRDAGGNLSQAARRLGISRSTLHRRLTRATDAGAVPCLVHGSGSS